MGVIIENRTEVPKSAVHLLTSIVKYAPHAVVCNSILNKITGSITVVSVAIGETMVEKAIPFDSFIQIIDGAAEVNINKKKYQLKVGCGIVIPAHMPYSLNAKEKFKMIFTVIKNGYEL
jgi:quercetin dioxygenase-like cupin family protein